MEHTRDSRGRAAWRVAAVALAVLILGVQALWAAPVDVETARRVAERWTGENLALPAGARALVLTPPAELKADGALHFFELQPQGLAVVAADDVAHPVVFYTDAPVDLRKNRPPQFDEMIRSAADEVRAAAAGPAKALAAASGEWQRLTAADYAPRARDVARAVSPLLATHWSQGKYYNASCPYDASSSYDSRCLVGCVAISMSQVMWFHAYPSCGTGTHQYTDSNYGVQSANFGATTYNWTLMPTSLSSYNESLATLLYQAGVSVDMNYGTGVSLAYQSKARDALVNYFGYSSSAQYVTRSAYGSSAWLALLYADLDAGYPLVYAGSGPDGGHSFNIDGYSSPGYFHVNWGWGSSYDGYFYLDSLSPASYTFNSNQAAVVNIRPGGTPSANDLVANRAYLASDSGGGTEIASANEGDAVYFCLDYSYTGTANLTACQVLVNLDGSQYISSPVAISAGASHAILVAGPWTATAGSHTQAWMLDSTGGVAESNEHNNSVQATFSVAGAPGSGDLVLHRVYASTNATGTPEVTSAAAGTGLYFFAEFSWTGTSDLSSCAVQLQIDGSTYGQGSLAIPAGASHYTVYFTSPWTATEGNHTYHWNFDYDGSVTESNESNNTGDGSLTVTSMFASPVSTDNWMPRGKYWIMWDRSVPTGKSVRLDLYRDGLLYKCIKKKTSNKGALKYAVKKTTPAAATYQIVLTELVGSGRVFTSDPFLIGMTGAAAPVAGTMALCPTP